MFLNPEYDEDDYRLRWCRIYLSCFCTIVFKLDFPRYIFLIFAIKPFIYYSIFRFESGKCLLDVPNMVCLQITDSVRYNLEFIPQLLMTFTTNQSNHGTKSPYATHPKLEIRTELNFTLWSFSKWWPTYCVLIPDIYRDFNLILGFSCYSSQDKTYKKDTWEKYLTIEFSRNTQSWQCCHFCIAYVG